MSIPALAPAAPTRPATSAYERFDQALRQAQVFFGRSDLTDGEADVAFAELLDTWLKDSPDQCAQITSAACFVLKTPTAALLKDRFASTLLSTPEGISADVRIELATYVVILPDPGSRNASARRLQQAKLILDQWHRLAAATDPKFDPGRRPFLMNSVMFLSSDPREMAAFRAAKAEAAAYADYYAIQDRYQRAARKDLPIIEKHLIDAFAHGPDDQTGLDAIMETRIPDAPTRQRIRAAVTQARGPHGSAP
jgi:hypothetical protein